MADNSPQQILVTRIAFTTNTSDTSQISFETYVERDAEVSEYHKVIDRLQEAAARQLAKAKLSSLKFELEGVDKQIGLLMSDVADRRAAMEEAEAAARDRHVKAGRRGEFTPAPAEKSVIDAKRADVKNTQTNLDGLLWRQAKLIEQIAEYERVAA
jgi:hypothetical protein